MPKFELVTLYPLIKAVLAFLLCFLAARLVTKFSLPMIKKSLDARSQGIFQRVVFYSMIIVGALLAMKQLGLDIGVLLGAAGLLTVAVGFAAQTSTANIISGIFLMFEKRFGVSDIIEVGANKGEIISIGLLSTEIRSFDNISVRIPNETLMKTDVKNLTRFAIRRIDLKLRVNLHEEFERVKSLLLDITSNNPLCLDEPAPFFVIENHSDAGLEFQFSVWAKRENLLEVRNALHVDILKLFERVGIEIPFPKRMIVSPGSEENADV